MVAQVLWRDVVLGRKRAKGNHAPAAHLLLLYFVCCTEALRQPLLVLLYVCVCLCLCWDLSRGFHLIASAFNFRVLPLGGYSGTDGKGEVKRRGL